MSESIPTRLYNLLPELYRWRDEQQGKPLQALLAILEREFHTLEVDSEAMYDNWFIQTCDNWVVPYLADLLGIDDSMVGIDYLPFTQRRRVANTLAYRRRKGTVAILEQVLWDVTNWHVRAVEFHQLLALSQHLQFLQNDQVISVSLGDPSALAALESPFSRLPRSIDVRTIRPANQPLTNGVTPRIEKQSISPTTLGKYNLHNVGLFFWRLRPYPVNRGFPKAYGDCKEQDKVQTALFTFSPTGHDTQLLNRPQSFLALEQRATAVNLPILITRAELTADLADYRRRYQEQPLEQLPLKSTYYGLERSFNISDLRQIALCTIQGEPSGLTALNQGILTNELRSALATTGLVLSQIVDVRPIQLDKQWLLEDTVQGKSYRFDTEAGKLHVVCIQQQILPLNIRSTDLSKWQNQALETLQKCYVAEIALFTLDPSLVSDLDAGLLSEALRDQFHEKGVTPSPNAKLKIEERGSQWMITDIWKRYVIRQEAQRLQVYAATGTDLVAIDPELGRMAFLDPHATRKAEEIRVDYTYGFSGDVGGGPYPRHFTIDSTWHNHCEILVAIGCRDHALEDVSEKSTLLVASSLEHALALWNRYCQEVRDKPCGLIRILDNGAYKLDQAPHNNEEENVIRLPPSAELSIVAEDGVQPTLVARNRRWEISFQLPDEIALSGKQPQKQANGSSQNAPSNRDKPQTNEENVEGEKAPIMDRKLLLSGLRLVGQLVVGEEKNRSINALDLQIEDCTFLEGGIAVELEAANAPALKLSILRSIVGPLNLPATIAGLQIVESILDSQLRSPWAPADDWVGYALRRASATLERCTVLGRITVEGELQANGTLFSEPLTVQAEGGEAKGLLRYCYIPSGSTVPICQDCLFEEQIPRPIFTSKRYGQPGYAQLSHLCAAEIRTGVGNIAEIGVFHHLYQPQREANIQTILKEYLPLGLDAGVFHVT